ncbi:hypothetical protein GFL63_30600, partial [Rhizobium leguminosarum bv. viciae]|uniref:hypothetical protein n=1 Tax=Rhizobium leguminosarum TaxID=384 RepID=UPI001980EED7
MDRREREVVISVTKPGECDIPTLQKQDTSTLRLQKHVAARLNCPPVCKVEMSISAATRHNDQP